MSRRTTLRRRRRELVLTAGGVGLLVAGVALPAYGTLLVAWGGTALFGAVLVVLFGETSVVRAEVATDVYAVLAGNCRTATDADGLVYVPGEEGVRLVTGDAVLEPTGAPLVDRIEDASVTQPELTSGRLQAVVDGLISQVELVDDATGETGDGEARVTASGCRIGINERFDHPVASAVGVGLARAVDGPVWVEADVEGEALVVSCEWGDSPAAADSLLEAADGTGAGDATDAPDGEDDTAADGVEADAE